MADDDDGKLSGPSAALPPARPKRFRSLASRLVLLGIVQLVLLAGTAIVVFVAEGPHEPGRPEEHIPAALPRIEALIDDAAALGELLDDLHDRRIEVTLYDDKRALIASNVDPPLALPERRWRRGRPPPMPPPPGGGDHHRPPPPHDFDGPPPGGPFGDGPPMLDGDRPGDRPGRGPRRFAMPIRVHGEAGLLVARGVHGEPPGMIGPLLVIVCGMTIVIAGALLTARWIVRPIERLSRTARALGTGDLAARSRLGRSDEIGELGFRVDEMADRIERLLVTEKELLANVAHELRTPLARIGVALDLAGEGDAEAARASLGEIAVDVSELETIVDDILTTMRFEIAGAARLPLRRSVVPARQVLDAAVERMRGRHPSRPLVVATGAAPADLPDVDVDPVLFRRVLDNLLENAHKYSPDLDAPIEISATGDGDGVRFEVRDRGIGISAEDLPRVFTAFFRGDRSRSRETGGVGLGLTLAKRIVDAHGGSIDVASRAHEGTTVRVRVPRAA
ncbi:MAG: HAMP domain-containing histidine kinase [Deltaproteobacteria bacterium]|nr:HAMP domain-containing histidine kinase [Deltaproteobacteria bacterium]MCW5802883.1 HAMP domain-containing histidine kinase [Deltaproteobacteria bacterium]